MGPTVLHSFQGTVGYHKVNTETENKYCIQK